MSPICLFLSLAPAVWLSLSFRLSGVNWMDFYCHPHSFCLISWLIVLVSVFLYVAILCCSIFLPIFLSHSPSLHLADDDINESTFIWQYISYHIASTVGLGIIYWCIKLVCLSLHTTGTVNQGHLSESQFTKSTCTQHKSIGPTEDTCNKHTDVYARAHSLHTNTAINRVYTPCSRNVTGMYMR